MKKLAASLIVLVSALLSGPFAQAQSTWQHVRLDEPEATVLEETFTKVRRAEWFRTQKELNPEGVNEDLKKQFWLLYARMRIVDDKSRSFVFSFDGPGLLFVGEHKVKSSKLAAVYEDVKGRFYVAKSGRVNVQLKESEQRVYKVTFRFDFVGDEAMNEVNELEGVETVGPHESVTIESEVEVHIDVICKRGQERAPPTFRLLRRGHAV